MHEDSVICRYPLIIAEGLSIYLFSSLGEAEGWLEAIDVADGAYVGFDSEGRALKLEASGVRKSWFAMSEGTTHISLDETSPTHTRKLKQFLLSHLEAAGEDIDATTDMETLVEICKRVHKYEQ